jgi:hypothetical protein
VNRHRFYADPDPNTTFHFDADPDPTFHFDADQDPDPDPSLSFTLVGISDFSFTFIYSSASSHCFIFLIVYRTNFLYFGQNTGSEHFWTKVKFSILFGRNRYGYGSGSGSACPWHRGPIPNRMRQNDADPTGFGPTTVRETFSR